MNGTVIVGESVMNGTVIVGESVIEGTLIENRSHTNLFVGMLPLYLEVHIEATHGI